MNLLNMINQMQNKMNYNKKYLKWKLCLQKTLKNKDKSMRNQLKKMKKQNY